MSGDDIINAVHIAERAHKGQKRKYNGAEYITHPIRVMTRYMMLPNAFDHGACAAVLHDVLEDCVDWPESRLIGSGVSTIVVDLVRELTNVSKLHPQLSRAERKALDREHIAGASATARTIKLIDRTDNLGEMVGADRSFTLLYLDESKALLCALRSTDGLLERELQIKIDHLESSLSHDH